MIWLRDINNKWQHKKSSKNGKISYEITIWYYLWRFQSPKGHDTIVGANLGNAIDRQYYDNDKRIVHKRKRKKEYNKISILTSQNLPRKSK